MTTPTATFHHDSGMQRHGREPERPGDDFWDGQTFDNQKEVTRSTYCATRGRGARR